MSFKIKYCGVLATLFVISASLAKGPISSILKVVEESGCKARIWKDRGVAPLAYIKGMALTYSRSFCRLHKRELSGQIMAQAGSGNQSKDAISYYEDIFNSSGLHVDRDGPETLRALYTLGIGLGMRESGGKYCAGFDAREGGLPEQHQGAGLFQTSYSILEVSEHLGNIYDEYRADPSRCLKPVFSRNVFCGPMPGVGVGPAKAFQRFTKSCPAFATELAMLSLRMARKHYGPINRREAEVDMKCHVMLQRIENIISKDPITACGEIN